jgi:hypothetical protein
MSDDDEAAQKNRLYTTDDFPLNSISQHANFCALDSPFTEYFSNIK